MTITRDVLSKYRARANVFIETGTHIGNTTQLAASLGFRTVYTIELSEQFYRAAQKKFASNHHVHCILGDSTEQLMRLLPGIDEPVLFWLDGHWSMGDTARGDKAVPIYEELAAIADHHVKNHTILIDDLRLMGNQDEPIEDWHEISLEETKRRCLEINPEYKFSFEDGHVPNDILVVQL
jgi:hypothetical protein